MHNTRRGIGMNEASFGRIIIQLGPIAFLTLEWEMCWCVRVCVRGQLSNSNIDFAGPGLFIYSLVSPKNLSFFFSFVWHSCHFYYDYFMSGLCKILLCHPSCWQIERTGGDLSIYKCCVGLRKSWFLNNTHPVAMKHIISSNMRTFFQTKIPECPYSY